MKTKMIKTAGISIVFLFVSTIQLMAKDEIYTAFLSNQAVEGYDTVAYFRAGKPVKGLKKHVVEYKGVDWLFSSAENAMAFQKNPDKYAPQYGGYCAWAVAQGYTAKGDPAYWAIHDGKLYLNYNQEIQNRWAADKANFIVAADKNWPGVIN